ncbi:MAG TPA: thioredoxin family protein [Thermoanaerobaculia bacterium]|nr:thioredoxin family protein [Thermoanaerobaculia bacterium]
MTLPLRFVLPSLALLAAASAAPAPAAGPAPEARTPTAAAAPSGDPLIYDPDLIGEKAIAFSLKVASDSGRRLLVNLGTNDCRPCAVFNHAIHKGKFFEAVTHDFVPVDIDVSNMPNAALIDKYLINPRAELPAILIFLPNGSLNEALAHGEMAAIARKGDDAVQEWLLARFLKTE